MLRLLLLFCSFGLALPLLAATCETDDFATQVSGEEQCLMMRRFGDQRPEVLLVWLHGDVSSGGPANYHFALAEKSAAEFSSDKVLAVALVRPGYPDGSGSASSVAFANGGRYDHLTKTNLAEVGAAIARLRDHYRPRSVIAIGHSGGAATSALLLGLRPGLIDAALLVACPCDLVAWRTGRRAWGASEDPLKWVERVSEDARVIALTGVNDDNTSPRLASDYVNALKARQIDAEFRLLPGETHNGAFRSPEVSNALRQLLAKK